jgi:RNA polymerase-binding protein DksA
MRTTTISTDSANRPQANSNAYASLEATLKNQRDELRRRLNHRLGDVFTNREPDDEGALATNNFATDLAIVTIERERRELKEIEFALGRIKAGEYGVCEACGSSIRKPRLQALPWARFCLACAEKLSHWH